MMVRNRFEKDYSFLEETAAKIRSYESSPNTFRKWFQPYRNYYLVRFVSCFLLLSSMILFMFSFPYNSYLFLSLIVLFIFFYGLIKYNQNNKKTMFFMMNKTYYDLRNEDQTTISKESFELLQLLSGEMIHSKQRDYWFRVKMYDGEKKVMHYSEVITYLLGMKMAEYGFTVSDVKKQLIRDLHEKPLPYVHELMLIREWKAAAYSKQFEHYYMNYALNWKRYVQGRLSYEEAFLDYDHEVLLWLQPFLEVKVTLNYNHIPTKENISAFCRTLRENGYFQKIYLLSKNEEENLNNPHLEKYIFRKNKEWFDSYLQGMADYKENREWAYRKPDIILNLLRELEYNIYHHINREREFMIDSNILYVLENQYHFLIEKYEEWEGRVQELKKEGIYFMHIDQSKEKIISKFTSVDTILAAVRS